MKEKYKIRHAILGTLQTKLSAFDYITEVDQEKIELTLDELAKVLRRPKKEVLNQIDYLFMLKEVHISRTDSNIKVFIVEPGSAAYFDSKYPQEGRKAFWNTLFDIAKTISTIVLLVFATITFIMGIFHNQRIEEDIRQLKQEVNTLKNSKLLESSTHQRARPR